MLSDKMVLLVRRLRGSPTRDYRLEMIGADFLAGAHLESQNPEMLLFSMRRFFKFLPRPLQETFLEEYLPQNYDCHSTEETLSTTGSRCPPRPSSTNSRTRCLEVSTLWRESTS